MNWTRRVFLKETVRGWVSLVLAPLGYALARRQLAHDGGSKIDVLNLGLAEEFPLGSSRIIMLGDDKVIVGRSADGMFHAVSGICTHLGCSIRFEESGGQAEFACNCHDSRFDVDGINLSGPAQSPLRRYEIAFVGKELRLVRGVDSEA